MKLHILSILAVTLVAASAGAVDNPPKTNAAPSAIPAPAMASTNKPDDGLGKVFKSDKEKFSYWIGMISAQQPKGQIKRFDIDFDLEAAVKGFHDNLAGGATLISESQMKEVGTELNTSIKAKMEAKAAKVKAEGLAFLENNKKQPGVVTLPSGLQYKILTEGTGTNAGPNDEVTVNYTGTLPDGTEFDSSAKAGRPFTTAIQGRIIQGWKQALQLMKIGSKWKIFIPTELAYGARPPTPAIPADSPLVFEIELLSAKSPAPAPMAPAMTSPASHSPTTPLTSDIIKVPSKEEMDKGAKVETIKAEDLEKIKATNGAATNSN